ncbi:Phospholipase/Carboxylesterase [Rosistilla carotiformis]|uniref:Phospholipase/Carboxylesterase n=1 Tax=Rosistilla carotiformis TaxID=2528017 RepID=A0A518JNG0_9BACT|nr:dienelactone hydrolase family protein [Rosistilla carotiformis]QDV67038.1 Phospholipase/Carboxylesterase [Rosistilla carotiformis]
MNRLWSENASASGNFSWAKKQHSQSAVTLETCGRSSFFLPVQYEPNYQYPLVIWLHNEGSDQSQMSSVVPAISMQNYIGVGVRAPRATDSQGHGFSWLQSESGIAITEQSLFDAIDLASTRYNINRDRVCVVGYREGGTMALRTALRHPAAFAGAISLGGRFPTGSRPLANLAAARKLPMMMALGTDESTYPTNDLCRDLRHLHAARVGLDLRQYDVRNELHPQILSDVNEWIMALITGIDTLRTATMCDTEPVEFSAN